MDKSEIRALIGKYTADCKHQQHSIVTFAFLQIFTNVGTAISLKLIVDLALLQRNLVSLVASCAGFLLCALGNVLFSVMKQKSASMVGESAVRKLRSEVFEHYLNLPAQTQEKIKSGDLLTLCMQDTASLKEIFASQYTRRITNTVSSFLLVASMFFMDWRLTILVVFGLPFFLLSVFLFGNRLQSSEKEYVKEFGSLNQIVLQSSNGAEVIKHLGAAQDMKRAFSEKVLRFKRATQTKEIYLELKDISGNFLSTAFVGFFMVVGGHFLLRYGSGSPGVLLSFMMLIPVLYLSIVDAIALHLDEGRGAVNLERIREILNYTAEAHGRIATPLVPGDIRLENVSFSRADRTVLHNIGLTITQGEKVAIVGKSGSGKSTLLYIIAGLYAPDVGSVFYADHKLCDYSQEAKQRIVGMVEQEPFFFDDTVQNNISGRLDAEPSRVRTAAGLAGLELVISDMPNGYETELGEKTILSGGQKQRLAVARILYQDPYTIILDEPTSALDEASQNYLLRLLEGKSAQKTIVFATHSMSLAAKASRVIHIVDGHVVFDGNANSFMA